MIGSGFSYDENIDKKKITMFGIEWSGKLHYGRAEEVSIFDLENSKFGKFIISKKASENIKEADHYKVLSLLYEQVIKDKNIIFSITLSEEKEHLVWKYDNYISLSLEDFLNHFPSDFIEIQQRALLNLYNQYPDYGQEINTIDKYYFFAKDDTELFFFLNSMKNKYWINIGIEQQLGGGFIFTGMTINDEGWLEIEKTIKKNRKKQIFIAMKFKDMDNVYNTIYKAIDDAKFIPLRIDKKEHVNQISSEIQYEISKSGLVVADVTGQNQGVYFEAGYAMGLNIPVIWTCKDEEDEKNKIHFDTRQYNTIFWKDEKDLLEKLKNRIEAVMGLLEKGHPHA